MKRKRTPHISPIKGALDAINRAVAAQGYVIAGMGPGTPPLVVGHELYSLGGYRTWPHHLVVDGKATRRDWDDQLLIFGVIDPSPRNRGQKFYRCHVVKGTAA